MNADPTPYIAAAWLLSFLTLGGLTLHAVTDARRAK